MADGRRLRCIYGSGETEILIIMKVARRNGMNDIFSNNNKTDVTMRLKRLFLGVMLVAGITGAGAVNVASEDIHAFISLKEPGNDAMQ